MQLHVEDRNLEKYEVTMSFEGLEELMEEMMTAFSDKLTIEELEMSLGLLENLDDMK